MIPPATTRARTTAPCWARTISPASPGCRRSPRATARAPGTASTPDYESPGIGGAPGERRGATYNRLGPAVALTALGEAKRWSQHIASDDSSQATALAAAAAARVLQANRALTATELRAVLALTADVPAVVDPGRGLEAGAFDARDRLGHNFKIGHGTVNARAASLAAEDPICLALLATRVVPDTGAASQALARAQAWRVEVLRAAGRGDPTARAYARAAGPVSRLFMTSLPVQEALCWLARHARALQEGARTTHWQPQHHGALVERIRHVSGHGSRCARSRRRRRRRLPAGAGGGARRRPHRSGGRIRLGKNPRP